MSASGNAPLRTWSANTVLPSPFKPCLCPTGTTGLHPRAAATHAASLGGCAREDGVGTGCGCAPQHNLLLLSPPHADCYTPATVGHRHAGTLHAAAPARGPPNPQQHHAACGDGCGNGGTRAARHGRKEADVRPYAAASGSGGSPHKPGTQRYGDCSCTPSIPLWEILECIVLCATVLLNCMFLDRSCYYTQVAVAPSAAPPAQGPVATCTGPLTTTYWRTSRSGRRWRPRGAHLSSPKVVAV